MQQRGVSGRQGVENVRQNIEARSNHFRSSTPRTLKILPPILFLFFQVTVLTEVLEVRRWSVWFKGSVTLEQRLRAPGPHDIPPVSSSLGQQTCNGIN